MAAGTSLSYAYPDEWSIVTKDQVSTPFFDEYAANFDPDHIIMVTMILIVLILMLSLRMMPL